MSLYDIDEETLIDEYGVCHKGFSLRDELEYNAKRQKEKNEKVNSLAQSQQTTIQQSQNANSVESFMDKLGSLYQEYFVERNYQNRYRKGCTPQNIAYNTISNYKISPNPKLIDTGNFAVDLASNYAVSKVPVVKEYSRGEKIGNGIANVYNAMDEAGCFK